MKMNKHDKPYKRRLGRIEPPEWLNKKVARAFAVGILLILVGQVALFLHDYGVEGFGKDFKSVTCYKYSPTPCGIPQYAAGCDETKAWCKPQYYIYINAGETIGDKMPYYMSTDFYMVWFLICAGLNIAVVHFGRKRN